MYGGLCAWSSAEPEGLRATGAPLCYVLHVNTTHQYYCTANALDYVTIGWRTHHLSEAQQAQVRLLNPS